MVLLGLVLEVRGQEVWAPVVSELVVSPRLVAAGCLVGVAMLVPAAERLRVADWPVLVLVLGRAPGLVLERAVSLERLSR